MRSSTPPCPGSSPLESFTPALRLMSDSTRSPTTLMAPRKMAAITSSHQPPAARRVYRLATGACQALSAALHAAASTSTPASPPHTPSQLLPGLMAGASLRRVNFSPNVRPAKYAKMSATQTSTSTDSRKLTPISFA